MKQVTYALDDAAAERIQRAAARDQRPRSAVVPVRVATTRPPTSMIHLDTSVLIDALTGARRSSPAVRLTMTEGHRLAISAPGALHKSLPRFHMVDTSYKSTDSHANLQVTFMQHQDTGELAADIDIDEASGFGHGFEVIRNAITTQKTNPYLVRELLLLRDPVGQGIDPKYRFVFE